MERTEDQCVQIRCRYCKRNVSQFGCRCDQSGRISGRQLRILRDKFFNEGSFNEEFSGLLFFQVIKYIVEIGVPNILNVNSRQHRSVEVVYEAYARDNKSALVKQIYCERDRITIYLNLLFPYDRHVTNWNNINDNHANEESTVLADQRRQYTYYPRLTLGYTCEIPVTIRISGRSFYWEHILQSVQSGNIRLHWRCTSYERNASEPIEYETEIHAHGITRTGMEDYAEDDEDFERILNILADEPQNAAHRAPAATSAVEKLITVNIREDGDKGMCCICQDQMNEGDLAKEMPCHHIYHGKCIFKWLTYANFCPVCKHALPITDQNTQD